MRLKKIPMESTIAEFWKVVLIPEPTPRAVGGRLFMISARLGEENSPWPSPFANRSAANCQ